MFAVTTVYCSCNSGCEGENENEKAKKAVNERQCVRIQQVLMGVVYCDVILIYSEIGARKHMMPRERGRNVMRKGGEVNRKMNIRFATLR